MKIERLAKNEAATERIARELAKMVKPPLVILLEGELGAGKTTFARGFVQALAGGAGVVVQSPTFALARSYATTPPVHHLDLYRLDDARGVADHSLEELGLVELLRDDGAIALVEWPRDLAPAGPTARVQIRDADGGGRHISVDLPDASATKVRSMTTSKSKPRRRA
ncbi:MAG TPA: tRNA (adenosine(37)-N6)-threonylcarbamoyltransferase complex ATPase subunit type 1 TsaE [Myxococcota bacterium]|jgi:hypothetical protein